MALDMGKKWFHTLVVTLIVVSGCTIHLSSAPLISSLQPAPSFRIFLCRCCTQYYMLDMRVVSRMLLPPLAHGSVQISPFTAHKRSPLLDVRAVVFFGGRRRLFSWFSFFTDTQRV